LDSKENGLGYMDDRSKSLNKASNLNNVGDSINNQRDIGVGASQITDVNKSMDMSGANNQEPK
jgi:hypothetical protein